jgi:hypothetical protein
MLAIIINKMSAKEKVSVYIMWIGSKHTCEQLTSSRKIMEGLAASSTAIDSLFFCSNVNLINKKRQELN